MKTVKPILAVCFVVLTMLLPSCFPDHSHKDLRIKIFTWENVRYYAEYSHRGLLKKLKATDRKIEFYYDENQKLYRAEIILHGSPVSESVFEYEQGPKGITRITWTRNGELYVVTDFTYAPDGKITNVLSAFGGSTDPYNQHNLDLTYQGNNVSKLVLNIGGPFTQMRTGSFDNKKNPFRMLAKSVNNPAFFPVGYYVFYQVVDYNIPYISWLSENNPGDLIYETVGYGTGGGFQLVFPMTYTYNHDLVTKITWGSIIAPADARTFEFEYGLY
jgi:hypothetical protein